MFELILWAASKFYEEVKDSISRSGAIYEEIGAESAESLGSLLGLNSNIIEEAPCPT